MGDISIWHWLVLLVFWVAIAFPVSKIAARAGHAAWISYLMCFPILPFGLIIYLWVLALKAWPGEEK